MTKKHFNALASALKATQPTGILTDPAYRQWIADVAVVADVCQSMCPNFDRDKWTLAIYGEIE